MASAGLGASHEDREKNKHWLRLQAIQGLVHNMKAEEMLATSADQSKLKHRAIKASPRLPPAPSPPPQPPRLPPAPSPHLADGLPNRFLIAS